MITIINDTEARMIASHWHSGAASPLYALSSTGTITNDTVAEIQSNIDQERDLFAIEELSDLRDYCQYHGIRGPQDGWSKLNW